MSTHNIWAATWQSQQNECAPSEDPDQPGHPPSLIRVFAVRSLGSNVPKLSSCGQRSLWSDWADAQADLSLRWAHTHFVGFVVRRLICFYGELTEIILQLLAHLSRRLTRWAYSIPMIRRSYVVRRPHFQTWISLKPVGQSWSNFLCSITRVGERVHKVLGKIGSKLWFPWQQKAPIDL